MSSVKYDPVPFATTATTDALQQHESIMSAFARHRDALRHRAADTIGTGLALGITYTVYRHAGLHAPEADLLLATLPSALLIGIVCLYMPCDAADATVATLACTPLVVWRSPSFLCLALGDAVLIVIDVFAIAYAPKPVWKLNFRRPTARWRGVSTPSTGRCPRKSLCSMAWRITKVGAIFLGET